MIDEKALEAAFDAFEPLSSVLRYRGKTPLGRSNWHACDRMALEAAITAYLSALPAGWQPIETAPKDGTRVLGCNGESVEVIFWARDIERWFNQSSEISLWGAFPPTHWRPLPEPPGSEATCAENAQVQIGQSGVTDGIEWVVVDAEKLRRLVSAASAPAPTEEEIARLLCVREGYDPNLKASHFSEDALWTEWVEDARAILALFAPILAEKERIAQSWEKECEERTSIGKMALDRALAAEAALAAERERGARLLIAEYEAQTLCLLPILGEALKWRRRVTEDLKELIPYVAQIAAPGAAMEAQDGH